MNRHPLDRAEVFLAQADRRRGAYARHRALDASDAVLTALTALATHAETRDALPAALREVGWHEAQDLLSTEGDALAVKLARIVTACLSATNAQRP